MCTHTASCLQHCRYRAVLTDKQNPPQISCDISSVAAASMLRVCHTCTCAFNSSNLTPKEYFRPYQVCSIARQAAAAAQQLELCMLFLPIAVESSHNSYTASWIVCCDG